MKSIRITDEIMPLLSAASVVGNLLKLPQMHRPLYAKVDHVLKALGGKWDRREGAHKFDRDIAVELAAAIEAGEVVNRNQAFGFFPTPHFLVDQMLAIAEMRDGLSVLEPSAGDGRIACQIMHRWPNTRLTCFELMPENVAELNARGIRCEPSDFLKAPPQPIFDRVIANPPFNRLQYVDHILHMLKFVRPNGGKIVTIASAGFLNASGKKVGALRAQLEEHGANYAIYNLPEKSFATSGTDVGTIIIETNVARKRS
ncbi:MAG: methyltransferase [Bradyrhizobiaceae bacterium]|nr:methyltransferase [Bradyrhizobiaceae bacterium]